MMQEIGILGAGLIGASWASFFAAQGLRVRIYDVNEEIKERALEIAGNNLQMLVHLNLLSPQAAKTGQQNLQTVNSLSELLSEVDYVQESVIEDYTIKAEVYREFEQYAPDTAILASSSSGLLMTKMQSVMQHPERALIAHPFNPPHLIPLVELVPGEQTAAFTVDTVKAFFLKLGKHPVVLNKEVPGHIANRLAAAVWRESLALLDEGVASVEDIDAALCKGPGLRWAMMGQHLIYELGGGEGGYQKFFDTIGASFEEYWKEMQVWTTIPDSAKQKAVAGTETYLNQKSRSEWSAWRDQKLARIQQVLSEE
ncbi:MAG: 3-hydroxyacyl-CoA dehydrogenase family protein [Planctomycetes bacterium]|nr:3-hydroxyacyl-CoA dehydrogenase family protein [Planctomycetota bacterium]MCH9724674.1 3-hydroxyacyl-CoA dehydrogenase family protein [Planctomycetota bacterium]MCH9774825.1 3-hydroxyacyl-CoA dehydrogenase family protein [Planctomycetota bacterium]MCH9792662.1 3-hydroxyacyl-CoA dehydrogenase family protein [Planctomycetota bacterium]